MRRGWDGRAGPAQLQSARSEGPDPEPALGCRPVAELACCRNAETERPSPGSWPLTTPSREVGRAPSPARQPGRPWPTPGSYCYRNKHQAPPKPTPLLAEPLAILTPLPGCSCTHSLSTPSSLPLLLRLLPGRGLAGTPLGSLGEESHLGGVCPQKSHREHAVSVPACLGRPDCTPWHAGLPSRPLSEPGHRSAPQPRHAGRPPTPLGVTEGQCHGWQAWLASLSGEPASQGQVTDCLGYQHEGQASRWPECGPGSCHAWWSRGPGQGT